MVEARGARFGRLLGLGLLLLLSHSMNAETPALPTGIEGTVTISPSHGGPSREGVPDSAPMKNANFLVEGTAGKVATFKTDDQGNFKVALPPGRYSIKIQEAMMKARGCGLTNIEVTTTGYKKIDLNCDIGLR